MTCQLKMQMQMQMVMKRLFSQGRSLKIKMGEDQQRFRIVEEKVKYRTHGNSIHQSVLDPGLRLGNSPIYQNPLVNFDVGGKRLSLAFGVVGVVFSHLMFKSGVVPESICDALTVFSLWPFPVVSYLSQPFVSRVWRVYNSETGEPLEQLILEKVKWSGFGTFNEMVDTKSLQTPNEEGGDYRGRFGFVNLLSIQGNSTKYYYINEGFSNIKMDTVLTNAANTLSSPLKSE